VRRTAFLIFILAGLIAGTPLLLIGGTSAQGSPVGTHEFDVLAYGTYLRADDITDYGPEGGHAVAAPLIVDLAAIGLESGDVIMVSYTGVLYENAYWDGTLGDYISYTDENEFHVYGVFSSTSQLLPITQLHRVPGAIQTELSYQTANAWFSNEVTDIPQDFRISPYMGMDLEIPENAQYLFVCLGDVYYPDNAGSVKLLIEVDSDDDGLLDSWETNGVDIDRDGVTDLNLEALGADWEHKDIFVEIDYMGSDGTHSHRPDQGAIDDVVQAFADAPVDNPDDALGISLHVFVDEQLPHSETINWNQFDLLKSSHFGTAAERTNPKNVEAKKQAFHYCIFAHSQENTTSSGSGEMPGNDFMVTLGNWTGSTGTREEQAATFMHELGHNLGLNHGGGDDVNYKPNYISVMNYLFQVDSYGTGRALDYSWGGRLDLNEANLNETEGIGTYENTVWVSPNGTLCTNAGDLWIDWNFDGNYTGSVQVNVNNYPSLGYASAADESLTDYDDWGNLVYRFRSTLGFADGQHPELPEELTVEVADAMSEQAASIAVPVIPDFASYLFLPFLMFATIATIAFKKRSENNKNA
jgi:hypothetical protein